MLLHRSIRTESNIWRFDKVQFELLSFSFRVAWMRGRFKRGNQGRHRERRGLGTNTCRNRDASLFAYWFTSDRKQYGQLLLYCNAFFFFFLVCNFFPPVAPFFRFISLFAQCFIFFFIRNTSWVMIFNSSFNFHPYNCFTSAFRWSRSLFQKIKIECQLFFCLLLI